MEVILKYAGIGGLGITLFFLLIKNFLKYKLFSKLGKNHSFRIVKLSIWLLFILSTICLMAYFLINSSFFKNEVIQNTQINGNGNIILNGNGNITKGGELEFFGPDSLFLDYMMENEGRTVYVEMTFSTYDFDGYDSKPDENGFYKVESKDVDYTFTDGKPKGTYIEGELKSFSANLLWPLDGGKTLSVLPGYDQYLYGSEYYETLKVLVNKDNEGALYYNRGQVDLKGYFRPYYVLNHGYNILTLKSQ